MHHRRVCGLACKKGLRMALGMTFHTKPGMSEPIHQDRFAISALSTTSRPHICSVFMLTLLVMDW